MYLESDVLMGLVVVATARGCGAIWEGQEVPASDAMVASALISERELRVDLLDSEKGALVQDSGGLGETIPLAKVIVGASEGRVESRDLFGCKDGLEGLLRGVDHLLRGLGVQGDCSAMARLSSHSL